MRSNFLLLWIILSLHCFFSTFGIWESMYVRRRCKCLRTTNDFIHQQHFHRINIYHERENCRRKEIIIFLKNRNRVCVNPEAEWVQVQILNKKGIKEEKIFEYFFLSS
ncbi:C-X-C motif chemokine 13-like [Eleutherodactylus coqui]|uniref:C-X-C motif chemokine 13-like n=1 Tax=Eleutherodactylus coqui TaxID=57060 RepID=UPI003461EF24